MALDAAKNFAKVTVSTGYDASATSVILEAGGAAELPAVPFNMPWWNATDYSDPSDDPNREIVRCTAIASETLTVTRAQEGTIASTKNTAGKTYKMHAGPTAKLVTDIAATYLPIASFVPGGSTTQIQYNNAGVLGGDANLVWDAAADALVLPAASMVIGSDLTAFGGAPRPGLLYVGNDTYQEDLPYSQIRTIITDPLLGAQILEIQATYDMTGPLSFNYGGVSVFAVYKGGVAYSGSPIASFYVDAIVSDAGTTASNITPFWIASGVRDASTVTLLSGLYLSTPVIQAAATVTTSVGIYLEDPSAADATNTYAFWSDSPGVYRIKGDGVMAYYNPAFTPKYTPGGVDYERVVQQWSANVLQYGTEAGGTGVLRAVNLIGSSVQINGVAAVTLTGAQALSNKTGNISQWTNDSGYVTSAGNAQTANPLSQFAATTSLQLKGVISDETGSGALVFADTPTLVTPVLGVASATSLTLGTSGILSGGTNLVEQVNGTNAQTFNLYNTSSSANANYERLTASWIANVLTIKTQKAGTGIARAISIVEPDGNSVLFVPISYTGTMTLSAYAQGGSVFASGRVALGHSAGSTATSGTNIGLSINESGTPSATSSLVTIPLRISPTINYAHATPGTGGYEALKIAVTETALPTGAKYLIRASAGAAGATDKFTVTNAGVVDAAGGYSAAGTAGVATFGPAAVASITIKNGIVVAIS